MTPRILAGSCISVLTLAIAACSPPTVDTSTDEALENSLSEVRASLEEEQRERFDDAVPTVMRAGTSNLDGLTGGEVIAFADSVEEAWAREEIAKLEAQKAEAQRVASRLSEFEVERANFFYREVLFGTPEPMISTDVVNHLDQAVGRVFFEATLRTPGRSTPWVRDRFGRRIRGGLEPGESAWWTFVLDKYGEWGGAPAEAVLTLEVLRVDGADGNNLFGQADWDAEDQARLDSLRAAFPEPSSPSEAAAPTAAAPLGSDPPSRSEARSEIMWTLKATLTNFRSAQEMYYQTTGNFQYAPSIEALQFDPGEGVSLEFLSHEDWYAAVATHEGWSEGGCALYDGENVDRDTLPETPGGKRLTPSNQGKPVCDD